MSSFLDVNDEYFAKKLLVVDNPHENESAESDLWPGLAGLNPTPRIITPSQRKEASQCKFVIPNPGLCIKTKDATSGKKVFVNLCHSEDVPEPQVNLSDQELADILDSGTDNEVDDIRLPMSIGDKREEVDKGGAPSFAFDVIVNTNFFNQRLMHSEMYRTFFIVVALEGIEEKHKMDLNKNTYKVLQNVKSFGKLAPQFLRSKAGIREVSSSEVIDTKQIKQNTAIGGDAASKANMVEEVTSTSPINITIIQVSEDLAKAQAKLPAMVDPRKLRVMMGADRIFITSPVGCLDVYLPLDIYQEKCRAEFNVTTSTLSLTMPLIVKP